MSVPALVTVSVLQVIQVWDDLLIGLLFLNRPDVRTITVGLATLQSSRMVDVPARMAGSIISALLAIVVYRPWSGRRPLPRCATCRPTSSSSAATGCRSRPV